MPGTLSMRIDGEWTFRSAHVAGTEPKPVPALAVRYAPDLDDHNATPAGRFWLRAAQELSVRVP